MVSLFGSGKGGSFTGRTGLWSSVDVCLVLSTSLSAWEQPARGDKARRISVFLSILGPYFYVVQLHNMFSYQTIATFC